MGLRTIASRLTLSLYFRENISGSFHEYWAMYVVVSDVLYFDTANLAEYQVLYWLELQDVKHTWSGSKGIGIGRTEHLGWNPRCITFITRSTNCLSVLPLMYFIASHPNTWITRIPLRLVAWMFSIMKFCHVTARYRLSAGQNTCSSRNLRTILLWSPKPILCINSRFLSDNAGLNSINESFCWLFSTTSGTAMIPDLARNISFRAVTLWLWTRSQTTSTFSTLFSSQYVRTIFACMPYRISRPSVNCDDTKSLNPSTTCRPATWESPLALV